MINEPMLLSRIWPKEMFYSPTLFSTRSSRGFAIPFVTVHFTDDKMEVTVFDASGKAIDRQSRLPVNRTDFIELLCELAGESLIKSELRFRYRQSN